MKVSDFTAKKRQAVQQAHKDLVLDAWDRLFPKEREARRIGKASRLDTDADVRRKAKESL